MSLSMDSGSFDEASRNRSLTVLSPLEMAASTALHPVSTPVCFSTLGASRLGSTVCNTLTIDKYLKQPHFNQPKLSL